MSRTDRLKMIARPHPQFSIIEQCALLKVPRSTLYYKPVRWMALAVQE